jgi:hypothetical protein
VAIVATTAGTASADEPLQPMRYTFEIDCQNHGEKLVQEGKIQAFLCVEYREDGEHYWALHTL